ncbi:MAG TPA: hypothetical protein VK926_09730 [Gaiellaceae bacterium]|nr:hypothetical protein [Gaiellaceae bacterium]
MTQATAATMQDRTTDATRTTKTGVQRTASASRPLEARLAAKQDAARKYRGTVRFFENRPWLLRSKRRAAWARAAMRRAEHRLVRTTRDIAALRRKLHERDARRLRAMPPKSAICKTFGRYCRQAVAVAWCESRLDPSAQNGQYLGLFQMGSYARARYGHGPSPHAQAEAAHAYFVESGRNWRPWSCKPGYAY